MNNPIMYYDPSGHSALLIIGLLAGSFALGFGLSVAGQGLSYGLSEINYWQAFIDGLIALGTTALSFTGIPAWGMALVGAGTGFGQYAMDCGFHNEQMTWLGAGTATVLGGIFGFAGGPGVRNSGEIAKKMVGLSDDGAKAIGAITKAINNRAANKISHRGFQATVNRFGKIAFNAVQDAIPGTVRHLMLKGIAPGIYLPIANAGASYLLGYAYDELGWC